MANGNGADPVIAIHELNKRFGRTLAVSDLTLKVAGGELFGFLGPNGAGKTTTIKILNGLLLPTSGRVLMKGIDIEKDPISVKRITGYVADRPFLYDKLTGMEFMHFVGGLYGLDKIYIDREGRQYLEMFDLVDVADELIEGYSHGMKQKLVISSVLLHRPEIFVVDEPMVGLDPKSARTLKDLFRSLCKKGVTVFLSTHTLAIAETLCDRVGIIQAGKLRALGSVADLRSMAESPSGDLEDIFLKLTEGTDEVVPT
ncbi:MAG: ABC transporter ATP-binding protein [Candidatus Wallbacteria bacterium]|nr:ABC transporter ATP-binding protein [Candidatus Wallbacteria bacterium]